MNILVIGNGFDLAHELPTKYTDFLFFCYAVNRIIKDNEIDDKIPKNDEKLSIWLKNNDWILTVDTDIDKISYVSDFGHWKYKIPKRDNKVYNAILDDFIVQCILNENKDKKLFKEILYLIFNNFWIEYFLQCDMHGNENWIDFESEISKIVKAINDKMHGLDKDNNHSLYDEVTDWPSSSYVFLRRFFDDRYGKAVTYKVVRDKLIRDLDKLIRVFEIYLTEYVEKINVKIVSPDIKEIVAISYDDRGKKGILFSKVISFNYTNIYEQVYLDKYNIDCKNYVDYIHGKADANNTIDANNMVLGIDEYLGKKKRNEQVEFVAFKKFYQRIHKGTGCKYKEWIDAIKEDYADYQTVLEKSKTEKNIMNLKATVNILKKQYLNKHHVYIFGHSLDVTDKDILRDLILNDNVHTTIYYHDKDTMGQQIANLVKVIGQKELIKRTGGKDKLIEFKLQKPMGQLIFENIMSSGVILSNCIEFSGIKKYYPDYLQVDQMINLSLSDKLNPSNLPKMSALVYNTNLYITDENGNIAYFDCDMQHTDNTGQIRKEHQEYKSVGGKEALHPDMDAGHFGLALGQHPSIAMEQHKHTNRYGAWRKFEMDWNKLSSEGHKVNVKAVFVEGDENGTYSPFWCIRESIDEDEVSEYMITNDDLQ